MTTTFSRPSPRIDRALEVARLVHDGAVRKGTTIPYIEHPVAVARLLEEYGYREDLVVAGLLHDTVEDAKYDDERLQRGLGRTAGRELVRYPADRLVFRTAFLDFLRAEFGSGVLALVMAVTETKNDGGPPRDWLERKKEQLGRLSGATHDEAALKAADAVHNIECTLGDLQRLGLGVLDRFRGGALVVWHYSAIAQLAAEQLPAGSPLAARVRDSADRLGSTVRDLRPASPANPRVPPPTVW